MASNNIAKKNSTWHYNIIGHFFVLLIIFIVLCICVILKENLFSKQVNIIKSSWFEYSKTFDMSLDDIIIEGRKNVLKQEISTILGLSRSSSFLAIDKENISSQIKTLPWIKNVTIKKTYLPNILQINIEEKKVIALYQENNQFFPLDETAQIINTNFVPKQEYIIVSGQGSKENLLDIMSIVSTNEAVFKRIKALQYISNRRWNIILDDIENGKTIKLPEQNYKQAWKKLLKLNQTRGLLKRPLTIIDLRFDNKVILKLNNNSKQNQKKDKKK